MFMFRIQNILDKKQFLNKHISQLKIKLNVIIISSLRDFSIC